jgi:small subunit ribosomal protein S3
VGQKTRPIGLRVGINRTWDSRWFAQGDDYAIRLHEDFKIRQHINKVLRFSGISKIIIERPAAKARVTIHTSRPGILIGKKGTDIDKIKKDLSKMVRGEISLNIVEVRKPEADAVLVAQTIAQQLEKRVSFRRAMKRAMQSAMRLGAKGIRVNVSGRLGGTEIARMEWYREGRVPLHTLRADIDYGTAEAETTYGVIGVKVWVYKGDIYLNDPSARDQVIANDLQHVQPENEKKSEA